MTIIKGILLSVLGLIIIIPIINFALFCIDDINVHLLCKKDKIQENITDSHTDFLKFPELQYEVKSSYYSIKDARFTQPTTSTIKVTKNVCEAMISADCQIYFKNELILSYHEDTMSYLESGTPKNDWNYQVCVTQNKVQMLKDSSDQAKFDISNMVNELDFTQSMEYAYQNGNKRNVSNIMFHKNKNLTDMYISYSLEKSVKLEEGQTYQPIKNP